MRVNLLEDFNFFKEEFTFSVVLDTETTIVDGSPSPFDGAKIIRVGECDSLATNTHASFPMFCGDVLVGHNIKFDLVHLMCEHGLPMVLNYLSSFRAVVDTSINEYILSGHTWKFPSLRDCAKKYGVVMPDKDEVHDNYFAKGLGADHVPPDLLDKYLAGDVRATYDVWRAQYKAASPRELAHFFVQGWATVVYAIMEYHGLHFNKMATARVHHETYDKEQELERLIVQFIHATVPGTKGYHDTVTGRALSTVFFNTPGLPVKEKVVVGKYKNGKPKVVNKERRLFRESVSLESCKFPSKHSLVENENLGYPVGDKILELYHNEFRGTPEGKVAELVRRWRGFSKLRGTYLDNIVSKNYVMHPTFHQTQTATGRTSSANPNAQNLPPEVRELVMKDDARVASFDFSQLELWAAAELSGDPVMLKDVRESDVHYETGKTVFGWTSRHDMDKETRRKIKGVNFGYIYGGGAKTLSEQSGVPIDVVRKIIRNFKSRYRVYTDWCEANIARAQRGDTSDPKVEDGGYVSYMKSWLGPSGRTYKFREVFDKFSGTWNVSPSQVKNYPVQGFATADYVPLFLVCLFIYTGALAEVQPFAAVHDSASMYLTEGRSLWTVQAFAEGVSGRMGAYVQELYSVHLRSVPKIEWEEGVNWS